MTTVTLDGYTASWDGSVIRVDTTGSPPSYRMMLNFFERNHDATDEQIEKVFIKQRAMETAEKVKLLRALNREVWRNKCQPT